MGDQKRLRIDVLLHHVVGQMMTSCVYYNQSYGAITRIGHPPLFTHAPKVSVKGTSNKVTLKCIFKPSFSMRDTNEGYQSAFKPQQIFKKKFFPNYSLNTNINVGTLKVWLEVIG